MYIQEKRQIEKSKKRRQIRTVFWVLVAALGRTIAEELFQPPTLCSVCLSSSVVCACVFECVYN